VHRPRPGATPLLARDVFGIGELLERGSQAEGEGVRVGRLLREGGAERLGAVPVRGERKRRRVR
jgi:hypothetical protein